MRVQAAQDCKFHTLVINLVIRDMSITAGCCVVPDSTSAWACPCCLITNACMRAYATQRHYSRTAFCSRYCHCLPLFCPPAVSSEALLLPLLLVLPLRRQD